MLSKIGSRWSRRVTSLSEPIIGLASWQEKTRLKMRDSVRWSTLEKKSLLWGTFMGEFADSWALFHSRCLFSVYLCWFLKVNQAFFLLSHLKGNLSHGILLPWHDILYLWDFKIEVLALQQHLIFWKKKKKLGRDLLVFCSKRNKSICERDFSNAISIFFSQHGTQYKTISMLLTFK